jgi:hypothetical protein
MKSQIPKSLPTAPNIGGGKDLVSTKYELNPVGHNNACPRDFHDATAAPLETPGVAALSRHFRGERASLSHPSSFTCRISSAVPIEPQPNYISEHDYR